MAKKEKAIKLLIQNEPPSGYYGCFSGGKDSVVIKHLTWLAGVKIDWYYNVTTIDPPELIYFIKKNHSEVKWIRPLNGNFFKRAIKIGFPTRKNRWCCREYKEGIMPSGAVAVMGIRAEESASRKKNWDEICNHHKTGNLIINPIYQWGSDDIWNFIKAEDIKYCSLYDEGFHRLGCVGCPQSRKEREVQFERWPKYREKWKRLFKEIWKKRTGSFWRGQPWFGDRYFRDSDQMFDWWLSDKSVKDFIGKTEDNCDNQGEE